MLLRRKIMNTYIAVFKSRTEVFAFLEKLKSAGVFCSIVPTPKEARVGCGLSAKFSQSGLQVALRVIKALNLSSFYGIFYVKISGNRSSTVRIY